MFKTFILLWIAKEAVALAIALIVFLVCVLIVFGPYVRAVVTQKVMSRRFAAARARLAKDMNL